MNKNGQSHRSAIEGQRKRTWYKRLLYTQKGRIDTRLEAPRLLEQTSKIFGESTPNDPTPVLQPILWRPSYIATNIKQSIKKFIIKGMQKIGDFSEWLLNYIPPKPNVVDKMLESFKKKI